MGLGQLSFVLESGPTRSVWLLCPPGTGLPTLQQTQLHLLRRAEGFNEQPHSRGVLCLPFVLWLSAMAQE